jgi:hypothetical protein
MNSRCPRWPEWRSVGRRSRRHGGRLERDNTLLSSVLSCSDHSACLRSTWCGCSIRKHRTARVQATLGRFGSISQSHQLSRSQFFAVTFSTLKLPACESSSDPRHAQVFEIALVEFSYIDEDWRISTTQPRSCDRRFRSRTRTDCSTYPNARSPRILQAGAPIHTSRPRRSRGRALDVELHGAAGTIWKATLYPATLAAVVPQGIRRRLPGSKPLRQHPSR